MQSGQTPDLIRLGATVRERRKALGLTQTELADRLGWTQERVSVLETGKYGLPSLPLLAHLAEALALPLQTLMEAIGYRVGDLGLSEEPGNMEPVFSYTLQRLLGIQALTLKDAMNQASDLMAQAMGAEKVDLFLYEEETETLVALGTSNTDLGRKEARVGLNRVPIANGGRQVEVFLTGKEFYTGHADQDPEVSRGVVHTLGVRSLYAVPLRVNDTIRGLVVSESVHPDRFGQSERDFFDAASRWVGMVAHRAQLHEELARRTADETRRLVAEEMLATVAHDLGNQITPIKGHLDLLLRRIHRQGPAQDAAEVARVSESLGRLSQLVNDLLDVSRLEGGIFSLNRRSVDLVDLVHQVVETVGTDRASLTIRAPERLVVEADPARMTQALQNLVGNAVQHTDRSVPVVVSVGWRRDENGRKAIIEVHDEGPGIAPDLLPQLFERHTARGDSAGLGLGLYLTRGIAAAHGGNLSVESAPGKGTTFILQIPMQD